MKIAVIGPAYPFRGGIAHYTALLAAYLSAEHDARLYSFKQLYPAWLYPGRSQIDPSSKPLADVEARRWLTPWWPLSWRRVVNDWNIWRPERMVMQWWVPFMAPMTAWLLGWARRLGIRSTLICHNVFPHERSRIDRALARLALGQADRLLVHSTEQQVIAQELLPQKLVMVVALPTYARFRAYAWTQASARQHLQIDGRVVLFFGLVRPYKGLLDLIDALPAVLREMDVTLLVVGEIWGDAALYRDHVQALGLAEKVHFVDQYVPDDVAAMYFAAADLVVLPYREATGSAVLQLAFGLGCPVVATRTGGMDEIVDDGITGFLVDPGDVMGLSNAIKQFFQEECAMTFRSTIEKQHSRFGWELLIRALEH